jgi:hypothetical protein
MNELELNRHRANLLSTARTMLNDEYQKKRGEEYTKWQHESNHLWISKGIMLPYPTKFGYPTEEEVVAKALQLYNAQNNTAPQPAATGNPLPDTSTDMTSSVSARLAEVSRNVKPVVLPEVSSVSPWVQYMAPEPAAEIATLDPVPEEPVAELPEIISAPALDLPPLVIIEPEIEDVDAKEEPEQTLEQIEEARQSSNLRNLLAQFITIAKGLDAKAQKDEGTPI